MDARIVPSPMTETDYYRLIRSHIEHENQLIGSRLNWLLVSQSFLIMAYAITVNGPARSPEEHWYAIQASLLLVFIPMLAVGVCVLTYASILGAIITQRRLRDMAVSHLSAEYQRMLPPVHGYLPLRRLGHGVPTLLPVFLLLVWIGLLFRPGGFPPPKHIAPPADVWRQH